MRLCIDYRRLNKITISDPYQMLYIEDLLNQVSDAVWLSKLDLNKGLYQVPLSRARTKDKLDLLPTRISMGRVQIHLNT